MKSTEQKSVPLGDLVAAIFDKAQALGESPAETSRLAAIAVMHFWLRTSKVPVGRPSRFEVSR